MWLPQVQFPCRHHLRSWHSCESQDPRSGRSSRLYLDLSGFSCPRRHWVSSSGSQPHRAGTPALTTQQPGTGLGCPRVEDDCPGRCWASAPMWPDQPPAPRPARGHLLLGLFTSPTAPVSPGYRLWQGDGAGTATRGQCTAQWPGWQPDEIGEVGDSRRKDLSQDRPQQGQGQQQLRAGQPEGGFRTQPACVGTRQMPAWVRWARRPLQRPARVPAERTLSEHQIFPLVLEKLEIHFQKGNEARRGGAHL